MVREGIEPQSENINLKKLAGDKLFVIVWLLNVHRVKKIVYSDCGGTTIVVPFPVKLQSLKMICVPPATVPHVVGSVNRPENSQLLMCVLNSLNVELIKVRLPLNLISLIRTRVERATELPIVTLPNICVVWANGGHDAPHIT